MRVCSRSGGLNQVVAVAGEYANGVLAPARHSSVPVLPNRFLITYELFSD